jgi:hypothetical protein
MVSRHSGATKYGTDLFRPELLSAQRPRILGRPDCDRAGRPFALHRSSGARGNISVAGAGSGARTAFIGAEEDPDRASGR